MSSPFGPRVRAPELSARGGWLNTGGVSVTLTHLRGKFVLLDFWTFACANCLHVLDELRDLEARYADVLVVIGVHSPKFAHEGSHAAVAAAVARYGVEHPVLDDSDMHLWRQYAVRAWPTLVLIDPAGYVIAQAAGEGQTSALGLVIDAHIDEFEVRGQLHRGAGPYVAPPTVGGELRFPAKAVRLANSLLVADPGHNRLVELTVDGRTVLRRIGSGARGRADGRADRATFAEPGGVTGLPDGLAGFDVVVADTANHLLRGVRRSDGAVVATIDLAAGLAAARTVTGAVPPVLSPWDVAWWPAIERVVVACAGVHLLVSWAPSSGAVEILAGTTVEGLKDGAALDGWLAQPSGLAVDGERLWFVDAETSSLRSLSTDGRLRTHIGEGLFDFGLVDGPGASARLQHPLGVAKLADASIAIADTYNGAIRRYDPITELVSTMAVGLDEPSGLVVAGADLMVVESGAHRLVPVPMADVPTTPISTTVARPAIELAPGIVELHILFSVPPGRKLNQSDGPATRVSVGASPSSLLVSGAGEHTSLRLPLVLADGEGVLNVVAQAASCDDDGTRHPACYVSRQDWGVPVRIVPGAPTQLQLMLLG